MRTLHCELAGVKAEKDQDQRNGAGEWTRTIDLLITNKPPGRRLHGTDPGERQGHAGGISHAKAIPKEIRRDLDVAQGVPFRRGVANPVGSALTPKLEGVDSTASFH